MPGPAGRFEWERLIKRAQLESTEKLIALLLATYADADGTRVHPGVQRLMNVSGKSRSTVSRAISVLLDKGFLECTFDGSRGGKKGMADEYKLIYPADESVLVLNPDEQPCGTHDTWSDQAYPQPSVTHDTWSAGDHVSFRADHVSPTPEPCVTHDTPPEQAPTTTPATIDVLEVNRSEEDSATCGQLEPDLISANGHKPPARIPGWTSKGRHARKENHA